MQPPRISSWLRLWNRPVVVVRSAVLVNSISRFALVWGSSCHWLGVLSFKLILTWVCFDLGLALLKGEAVRCRDTRHLVLPTSVSDASHATPGRSSPRGPRFNGGRAVPWRRAKVRPVGHDGRRSQAALHASR